MTTLRQDLQARIDAIITKKIEDIAAIRAAADVKVAALQVVLLSGDDLLNKDIVALEDHINQLQAMLR